MANKKVLFVEDRESDAKLLLEAFKQVNRNISLEVINDGDKAIKYVELLAKSADKPLPDLIILDIKLPKKDGREVLKVIKSKERLKEIPVVMFTNSTEKSDIQDSYESKVSTYLTKPLEMKELIETVQFMVQTWLRDK